MVDVARDAMSQAQPKLLGPEPEQTSVILAGLGRKAVLTVDQKTPAGGSRKPKRAVF